MLTQRKSEYQTAIQLADAEPRFRHDYAKFLASANRIDDAERQLREAARRRMRTTSPFS